MNVELAAYFHTRCGICRFFCSTTRGLLQHFKTAHADVFSRHEGLNEQLLYRWPLSSPCALCGDTFKQYHKCLIIRQMSMLMTSMGLDFGIPTTEPLTCPICRKGYSTAHGLQQHLRDYHTTVEACETLDPEIRRWSRIAALTCSSWTRYDASSPPGALHVRNVLDVPKNLFAILRPTMLQNGMRVNAGPWTLIKPTNPFMAVSVIPHATTSIFVHCIYILHC